MSLSIWVTVFFLVGFCAAICAIAYLGRRAFTGNTEASAAFSDFIVKASVLHLITIAMVVDAVIVLTLEKQIDGSTAGAILSGIVGYVLAGVGRSRFSGP